MTSRLIPRHSEADWARKRARAVEQAAGVAKREEAERIRQELIADAEAQLQAKAAANEGRHFFERSEHNEDRCAECGNARSWHPVAWR